MTERKCGRVLDAHGLRILGVQSEQPQNGRGGLEGLYGLVGRLESGDAGAGEH